MKYTRAGEAAAYLAVVLLSERAVSARHGVSLSAVRVLTMVAGGSSSGAAVRVTDLVALGLGEGGDLRTSIAECRRLGWLAPAGGVGKVGGRGALEMTLAGRGVVSELVRAWERSRKALGGLAPVRLFGRQLTSNK